MRLCGFSCRAAIKYYIAIFIGNGLGGVLSTINQNLPVHSGSSTYLMLSGIWTLLICGIASLIMIKRTGRKPLISPKSAIISSVLFGVISSMANLFVLISLETLDASVQYPLITGGTIVFSALICIIRREKLKLREYIAAAAAVISAVVVIL